MTARKAAALVLGLSVCRSTLAGGALKPGDAIPMGDVKMENVDGRKLSITDIAGKAGTLVIFTCNHCPFAQAWESRIAAIGNDSAKQGVGVVLVNANDPVAYPVDDLAHMKERAKTAHFEVPYVVDETSDVAKAFGATRTPEAFLFDAAGRLVYHGAIDDDAYRPDQVKQRYLQNAISALLAGKDVAVKETNSVGCSIKFRNQQEAAK
ncbi:MAG: thioredoxin family protein [Kiritimatiellae bacterium]|nr:thioredoxin family protein [Kiritimatiellia bacterium]